jgi:hypothetical protein
MTGDEVLPLFVAAGVTTVRDIGDEIVAETLVSPFAEAFSEKAPGIIRCSPLIDGDPPFQRSSGMVVSRYNAEREGFEILSVQCDPNMAFPVPVPGSQGMENRLTDISFPRKVGA